VVQRARSGDSQNELPAPRSQHSQDEGQRTKDGSAVSCDRRATL